MKNKKDIDIIDNIKSKYELEKNIIFSYENYTKKYTSIIDLFDNFDITQSSRQKVLLICQNSTFILQNHMDYNKIIEGTINGNFEKDLKFEKLQELKSQVTLSKNINDNNNNQKSYYIFIGFVFQISKLVNYIKLIIKKGYPKKIKITIKIENCIIDYQPNSFKFKNDKNIPQNKFESTLTYLMELYDKLNKIILKSYLKNEFIRFVYGRQFPTLIKYTKGKGKVDVAPFLRYFTNNQYKKESDYGYNSEKNTKNYENVIEDMLENITNFLKNVMTINKITFKDIYNDSIIKNNDKYIIYKGLFIYYIEANNLEKEIIDIYINLTQNLPIAQNILMCNEETSEEELTSFLYRAIKCNYNALFMIANLESLSVKQTNIIYHILNELILENKKNSGEEIKSCIIFLYQNKKLDIITQITKNEYCSNFLKPKNDNQNELKQSNLLLSNIEIIYSDKTGVGKSTQIKKEVNNKNNYIYFPFGGVLTRRIISERLLNLYKILKKKNENELKEIVIHFDLYETKQDFLMKDFLFSMLITKLYGNNENIFYLPKELNIKIEIPNSYISFRDKYPILQCIRERYMELSQLPKLIISQSSSSNIQIVCNYLKLFENKNRIETEDLYIPNISENDQPPIENEEDKKFEKCGFKITNIEILQEEECHRLIKKYLNIQSPNYYQIRSFIDTLGGQLRKLTNNYYLSAETLSFYNSNDINLKELRSFLMDSFIKNTEHFSKGAFEKLIKRQTISLTNNNEKYDDVEEEKRAIEALSTNETMISYDNIKPSLVFFHEAGEQTLSIITTCKKEELEYKRFLELYKSQNILLDELPNYKQFSQIEFLNEIKKILALKNPVTQKDLLKSRIDNNNEKKNEKEQFNNFIFDNEKNEKNEEKNDKLEFNLKINLDDYNSQIIIKKAKEKAINEDKKEEKKEEKNEKGIKKEDLKSLEEIKGNYVFTSDNFIKMVLILLIIRERVPVIMMGETGCGKTALIRKLSELINNGNIKMEILNIHAGTDSKDIIDFIEYIIPKARKLDQEEAKIKKKNKE